MGVCVGRHREPGERYPGGKLKRRTSTKPDIEPIAPALWQRIRQHGRDFGVDPRLTSELGRLSLHGELTVAMTVAGFRIGEIYRRFEAHQRLSRSPRSPSYNASYGESSIAEELLMPEQIEELVRRQQEARRAWESLEHEIPLELRNPVQQLCVEDRHISPVFLEDIRLLLARLSTAWNVHGAPRGPAANGHDRHGPPLHFNKHEGAKSEPVVRAINSAQPRAPLAPAAEKKPNYERIAWMRVVRAAAPHLTQDQLDAAFDLQQALKQREIFRNAKARGRDRVIIVRGNPSHAQ
jgi:hypothetical protein